MVPTSERVMAEAAVTVSESEWRSGYIIMQNPVTSCLREYRSGIKFFCVRRGRE